MQRKIAAILTVIVLMFSIIGCSDTKNIVQYDSETVAQSLETNVVKSNEKFELGWNDDGKFVYIKNLSTEKIWSTVPYNYYLDGGSSANVNSPIYITVQNTTGLTVDTLRGYSDAIESGRIFSEKIEDGIKVTYCFDNYRISIPVLYTLGSDCLKITIPSDEIVESDEYELISISVAPFLCATQNSKTNYLFIPSGSGAIMYADERIDGTRELSGDVYGIDASRLMPEDIEDETKFALPVFGAKDGNEALFAIVESSAESCTISAAAGNERTGYSNIYTTFYLRGYDSYATDDWLWSYQDLTRISDNMTSADMTVAYYPLSGDAADYNGMSARYRKYLFETKKLTNGVKSNSAYALNILGGVMTNTAAWGIPQKKLSVLTTFEQALSIVKDSQRFGTAVINMTGFGESGIDIGKIGGGFTFASDFGNDKKRISLQNYCQSKGLDIFYDFDLIRYSSSGNGFSYLSHSAKSATLHIAELYEISKPLRDYNIENAYRFIKRQKIPDAVSKLSKMLEQKNISAVCLSTLSSIAYSDYTDNKYYVKGSTSNEVTGFYMNFSKNGYKTAARDANAYAAVCADTLFDTPTNGGGYRVVDVEIPFYSMVFSGVKDLYGASLNLAENENKAAVELLSAGVKPAFTVINDYNISYAVSNTERLYGTVYSDVSDSIESFINKYSNYYESIKDSYIKEYILLENNISKTVYSNGVMLIANHSDKDVIFDGTKLEAFGVYVTSQ